MERTNSGYSLNLGQHSLPDVEEAEKEIGSLMSAYLLDILFGIHDNYFEYG